MPMIITELLNIFEYILNIFEYNFEYNIQGHNWKK